MNDSGGPAPGVYPVRFGMAELLNDLDRPDGWLLSVGGVAQSYVDLDDPTHLEFDYVRRIGDVIDCLGEPEAALDAVHVGGAGCTLPRYVASTRPGSRQLVLEADAELVELVWSRFRLHEVPELTLQASEGRTGLRGQPADSADLVVVDAFERDRVPTGLATVEFFEDVARVLRPSGSVVANIFDGNALEFTRRLLATLFTVFPHALLLAEPQVLRGRRLGNVVLVASAKELPVRQLTRRAASAIFPARCQDTDDLKRLCGNAEPLTDASPMSAPTLPKDRLGLFSS
ncbi:spermidine synthase [Allokutzneria oryzae]|uniref:Spermidine synthase n=1 Tax=Allokutzneria oryzae TaxID=1378989 RepID=A0ABV5ZN90_9PSEU